MLGWFSRRPPLDPVEKAWVETHMLALARQWGFTQLLQRESLLPHELLGTGETADRMSPEALAAQLCQPLGIEAGEITLPSATQSCGASEPELPPGPLPVSPSVPANPLALAAALARTLARGQLPGDWAGSLSATQLSWLADLAAGLRRLGCAAGAPRSGGFHPRPRLWQLPTCRRRAPAALAHAGLRAGADGALRKATRDQSGVRARRGITRSAGPVSQVFDSDQ